jgi:hypothetical protein
VLGFTTAQLNRDFDYGGIVENQLRALSDAGYFSENVSNVHTFRAHPSLTNSAASVESRVRSFLAVNCSNCHQPGGTTPALFDARLTTLTANAGLLDGPLHDYGANSENRVIKPGSTDLSMLLQRISRRGPGQMPPISTTVVDTNAVQLLTQWIEGEASEFQSFEQWQAEHFSDPQAGEAAAGADPDNDRSGNYLEFLLGTDPKTPEAPWSISAKTTGDSVQIHFSQIPRRGFEVQATTNLFSPTLWRPLDVPGNEPFFSSTTLDKIVADPAIGSTPTFYRVRIFEQ